MKGWLVRNKDGEYQLHTLLEPSKYKDGKWWRWGRSIKLDKSQVDAISMCMDKLPEWEDKKPMEVYVDVKPVSYKNIHEGSLVSYTETNWGSLLFGGLIYGGYTDKHTCKVLGVNWLDKKILVQKDGKSKAKWHNWGEFTLEE